MVAAHIRIEPERIGRPRGQHDPAPIPFLDEEGFPVASSSELDAFTASHEIVEPWIEGE
jgi:hypothetical protein